MLKGIRGLDHAVILVRDLDRARDTYQRLGFTLTPRGTHSLGSQNHCIMLARDYLELMALPKAPAAFQYFADFLAGGEGLGALALASDDAQAAHAELTQAGIEVEAPLALARPVPGFGEARFSLVQLPPSVTPGFRSFVCQHHTRQIVWRPEYQSHEIGATAIAGVAVLAEDASAYPGIFGETPMLFAGRAEIDKRLPGVILPSRLPPVIASLFIRVADRSRAATVMRRGGFSPVMLADGSFAIGADRAHGVALVFG